MKKRYVYRSIVLFFTFVLVLGSCKTIPGKEDPNFLGDYPLQSLGAAHLNIVKRFSNTLLPRDVSFVFEPRLNSLKFHHKMMGDNIWIYLSKENRAEMRNAIHAYLEAFENGTLTPEGAKKKGSFGTSDVWMTWGIFGTAHEATPTLRYDYQFITPERPYFILATATKKAKTGENSPAIRIAVSPSQCKESLLLVLDEENLMLIIKELEADYNKFDDDDASGQKDGDTVQKDVSVEEKKSFEEF